MKPHKIIMIMVSVVLLFTMILDAEETEFLNDQVLAFARENKGKQIGRGECWDLAAEPLNKLGASWDGSYRYGKKIGSGDVSGLKMEPAMLILPGDIIQFTRVQTSWTKTYPDGRTAWGSETLGMPHHTAIINNYDGKTLLTLLHQNVSGKRYIVETTLELSDVKSGTYLIYRPFRLKKSPEVNKSFHDEFLKK
jgi:myosin tail region-interacting protein MTI1